MLQPLAADVPRDAIEWLMIVFTVLGVVIAVVQSFRSVRVAQAAQRAIQATERHLASNHLISVGSQLEHLEVELAASVRTEDRDRAAALVVRWRQEASEVLGILEKRDDVTDGLLDNFRRLTFEASQTHISISDGSKTSLRSSTKELRNAASTALSDLARYSGALKSTTGGRAGNG